MELDDEVPLTEGSLLLVFDPRKNMSGIINLLGPRLFFSPVGHKYIKIILSDGLPTSLVTVRTVCRCKKLEMVMLRFVFYMYLNIPSHQIRLA